MAAGGGPRAVRAVCISLRLNRGLKAARKCRPLPWICLKPAWQRCRRRGMPRLPLTLLLCTILIPHVALAAGPADALKWGEPVGGLRVGIETAAEAVPANDPPRFRVVLQNVSREKIALPAAAGYVATPHESAKGFRSRPLKPVIERVEGIEPTYGMTGGPDLLADVAPGGGRA